ncbi:MAG: cob(I)yrinic acid a,c-diamide adenosyltransferase [Agathobacter sp.]|nr:cob(I)yrinic acid a,c-diamide adenosyltransferase [Agathobacter sp.]
MENGSVRIYYGEGRGKSMAALGSIIYKASLGGSAVVIQFLKGKDEETENFLKQFEPNVKFFRFEKCDECFDELSEEKRHEEELNLKNGVNFSKKVIATEGCDLVVLDEILGVVDQGIISIDEFRELIMAKPEEMSIICTGRVLHEEMREMVDEIYNITKEK